MRCMLWLSLILVSFVPTAQAAGKLRWDANEKKRQWSLLRDGAALPLLVVNLPTDGRPFIHPILAPDGNGILTEYSPSHHKHQTGLYVGFLQVNGRDYFHNRNRDYFRLEDTPGFITEEDTVATTLFKTSLLDKDGQPLLVETQDWTITDKKSFYILDLTWTGAASKDITFGQHDYGGLFLRMPWRGKSGGKAQSSEGNENAAAEGKKARWIDVGMPIAGRKDWGRIAILDHADNASGSTLWRVDGQLGVGPAPSRAAAWKIDKGKSARLRYRLIVYTGEMNKELIEAQYKDFVGNK